jgi:hypothetical protein
MAVLARAATSPFTWLALAAGLAAALLAAPLRLPLGPNYWDIYTYVDTAYRMSLGQTPHVDFFVPVGALGYVLYGVVARAFPDAHTLLAVQFSMLIVALPLMAIVAWEAARRSRIEAIALTLPFIFFGLMPMNGQELYPSPGFDGYGNYNRHAALLLYVLAAALLFVERRAVAAALAVVLLALLFMTKVTGFVVGVGLVIHAIIAGRMAWRGAAVGAALVGATLLYVQMRHGVVSAYIADIIDLVGVNTGSLLPRVLTVLSTKFDVVAATGLVVLLVLWRGRGDVLATLQGHGGGSRWSAFRALADHDGIWMLSLLAAGAVFETQNTGSHEFILLWPALLRAVRSLESPYGRSETLVVVLIAAAALPTPISVLHRAMRAVASAPKYEPLSAPLMGPVARVSVKPEIMLQSRAMLAHYPMARASYELVAKRNVLPSYILFSEIDFQASWLASTEAAAQAILDYEKANRTHFRRIATMDFVDPIPVMLKREPLRGLSIGNDPARTLMTLDDRAKAEIASADAILLPKCPVTHARNAIADAYAPTLAGRKVVALTPCFQMLVKE